MSTKQGFTITEARFINDNYAILHLKMANPKRGRVGFRISSREKGPKGVTILHGRNRHKKHATVTLAADGKSFIEYS